MTAPVRHPQDARPARMGALARLPVFLALEGKRAVVAGGAAAAAWKVELLSASGAAVDVYAIAPSDELLAVASDPPRGGVTIRTRNWTADDISGAAIAVGDLESDDAAKFATAARAAGVPVNIIDKPAFCDFSFGAIVNRSPLVIGISTDGAAPVFAQAIRAKLEAVLPQGFSAWAAAASRWRARVKQSGLSFVARRLFWRAFTAYAIAHPRRPPTDGDFERLIGQIRERGAAVEAGTVMLVGAGPGDPELLTLRAVRALQSADVILFDGLVSRDVLDFARREARKILVGKAGHRASCKQSDINALMVTLARQGRNVVRLKGGDPLIFARADEELEACRRAGVAVEIVPGISAAQGAASRLGVPLTGRDKARRVQFIAGHDTSGGLPADIDWHAVADGQTTTAIYMPAKTLAGFVENAVRHGLDPGTSSVAIANATRAEERRLSAPIAELPAMLAQDYPEGPILVMLGKVLGDPH
jgi:uroporphyrin-III C-methyltransferase / precorrin-2 dehydrogenase / sirohydrochlorin ferrochelatase